MLKQCRRIVQAAPGAKEFTREIWCQNWKRTLTGETGRSERGQRWVALWGNGDHGRLGLASAQSQWTPILCTGLQQSQPIALACGGAHTLVLTEEGRVYAAGLNDWGQLGVPDTLRSLELVEVEGLPDHNRCVHIAAGHYHSAAVSEDGGVYVWGKKFTRSTGPWKAYISFQFTSESTKVWRAQRLEALKDFHIKMLACGSEHSLALSEEGDVLSWGATLNGQLGHLQPPSMFRVSAKPGISLQGVGTVRVDSEYAPRIVKHLQDVKVHKVAAGLMHSACLDEQGVLFTFGKGRECQLGLGSESDVTEPTRVPALPAVVEVSCGGYHTGAITRRGELYMWGSNEYGCLGFGYEQQNSTLLPIRVEGSLAAVSLTEVSCGWKHTAALTDDGRIFTWGWGGSQGTYSTDGHSSGGQLGLGNEFDYLEPTRVPLEDRMHALHVSCGFNHSGAILEQL